MTVMFPRGVVWAGIVLIVLAILPGSAWGLEKFDGVIDLAC